MSIAAMAREAGADLWPHDGPAHEFRAAELAKFAALIRAEALREAAGICEVQYLPGDECDGRFSAAILAAIDQPKA